MYKKSKFLTFLLSFFPGLGHIYLGLSKRGAYFISAVVGDILLSIFITGIDIVNEPITLIFIPIIWLAAVVDSMVLADKINHGMLYESGPNESAVTLKKGEGLGVDNKRLITLMLSMIPGAGHMYIGLMKMGVQIMGLFFLAFYLTDLLRISLFMLFVPVIWFYSIFDVMHKTSSSENLEDGDLIIVDKFKDMSINKNSGRLLGIVLIVIGIAIIFQNVAMPMIVEAFGYKIREYFNVGIVSLLFILGGIKLMVGSKE
ncbi:hypothetical protein [Clostridium ganghwense]|uniref:TM2 domain-containing protein n=1 Tax=Clostridium ganghwense TaxID=312089 RepID=A0ABT4CLI8_9CLOT|nr:hypothetical protein [Clostridium ganghwense]MCY6369909.1 hypothetical protein [Clostridium ganghwense]